MRPVLCKAFTCGAPVGPLATSKMSGTALYLDRSVAKGNRDFPGIDAALEHQEYLPLARVHLLGFVPFLHRLFHTLRDFLGSGR